MGLGMASAQKINDRLSTCPQSAACESLCLGDTSGQNLLYGGAAKDSATGTDFRAGPRLSQFLKTEALVVHPEEFAKVVDSDSPTDGVVWTPAELQARGLSGTQRDDGSWSGAIGMYRQARAAIDTSLDSLLASAIYKWLQTADPGLVAGSPAAYGRLMADLRQAAASDDPRQVVRLALDSLREELALVQVALDGQPNPFTPDLMQRRTALRKLQREVAMQGQRIRDLQENGYAPLTRFGSYAVGVRNQAGELVAFRKFESQFAANKAARKLRQSPQAAAGEITVDQSVMATKEHKELEGLSPDMAMMFADMLGVDRTEAFNEWLRQAVADQSALKRLLPRKGTPGYSEDGLRVLAALVTSNAWLASRGLHSIAIARAVENAPRGDAKDEAIELVRYIDDPKEEAHRVRSLLGIN